MIQNPTIDPYWDWAKRHASSFTNFTRDQAAIEDLAQEAWVAMWMELDSANKKGRSVNESFLKQKGRWKVLDVIRSPKARIEEAYEPGEVPVRPSEPATGDLAYHHPEVWAAVKDLNPRQREYVYLRFWIGLNGAELRKRGFGNSLWYGSQKTPGIRATLSARLGDLADAV